jgi:hypothetical protein
MHMDPTQFDGLTKALAAGVSRRRILHGLAVGAVGAVAGLPHQPALAQQTKQAICHHTGDPENPYVVIEVAEPAWATHYAHGDTPYVDCCTNADCAIGQVCTNGQCGFSFSGCVPATAVFDDTQVVRVGPLSPGSYLITDTSTGASKTIAVPYNGADTFLFIGLRWREDPPFYTGPMITFGGTTEDGAQVVHLSVFDPAEPSVSGRAACFTMTRL